MQLTGYKNHYSGQLTPSITYEEVLFMSCGRSSGVTDDYQMSFKNQETEQIAAENEERIEREILISELKKSGIKLNETDIVFITKDRTGQIVWLENGNLNAGLNHILDGNGITPGHAKNFKEKFDVDRSHIGNFLNKVIKSGNVEYQRIIWKNGHKGYEKMYSYSDNYYVLTGVGLNGFIVSAYPQDINAAKRRIARFKNG